MKRFITFTFAALFSTLAMSTLEASSTSKGDVVHFKTKYGADQYGTVTDTYSDGNVHVDYYVRPGSLAKSGMRGVVKNASELSPAVKCLDQLCQNARVHFIGKSLRNKTGTMDALFNNGRILISYWQGPTLDGIGMLPGNTAHTWRSAAECGVEVDCINGICQKDCVDLGALAGKNLIVKKAYSDGYLLLEKNSKKTFWRHARDITKSKTCSRE